MGLLSLHSEGFCPQGFGGDGFFPEEWQIPKWPDMGLDEAVKLHTVTLGGFKMKTINEEYLEGPNDEFSMQGRETYWQSSGKYFMYYCKRFDKWRIAEIRAFSKNLDGQCFAFVSDGHPGRDILNASLIKGWIEVEDGNWVHREDAGVMQVGKLGDQMAAQEEDEEVEGGESCATDDSGASGEKDSSCPVMPVVRKVAKKAGNWVKRLFPKYLGAPDEEDAIPEDDGDGWKPEAGEDDCQAETQDGCNFKEKFYIEKQQKVTVEKREEEYHRLVRMQNVQMKPEQTAWLKARIKILKQMVEKDQGIS